MGLLEHGLLIVTDGEEYLLINHEIMLRQARNLHWSKGVV
jgi:hypothetical protein